MKYATIVLALASLVLANAIPQAGNSTGTAPPGCFGSVPGTFHIAAQDTDSPSNLVKRNTLTLTLSNSVLKDQIGRTGYIASNYQFQFDNPPQPDALYSSGFYICSNGTLAHGSSNVWAQCRSGNFYNLYDRNWGEACNDVYILYSDGSLSGAAAGQAPDGQPTVTTTIPGISASFAIGGIAGQPTASFVSQIGDGQAQGPWSPWSPVSGISNIPYYPRPSVGGSFPVSSTSPVRPTGPRAAQLQPAKSSSAPAASTFTGAAVPRQVNGALAVGFLGLAAFL
ncbi:hypothetical protein DV736_g6230, partial [Chaetothyriales sp. CBS 134916]